MNSKEEQTNSEVTNLENDSNEEQQKDSNYIDEQIRKDKLDEESIEIKMNINLVGVVILK